MNSNLTKLVGSPHNVSSGPLTTSKDTHKMGVGGKFLPSKGDARNVSTGGGGEAGEAGDGEGGM